MESEASTPILPRLACADSAFPKLSHEVALQVIRDLGIGAVDVCVFPVYGHIAPDAVRADPAAAAETLLPALERTGLAVADVFLILGGFEEYAVNHPADEVRTESLASFEATVEFARRLASPGVTLLPGVEFDEVGPEASLQLAASELQRRAQLAAEAGLALSFEPHYQSITETPERTLELLAAAPDLSLALDHSHFVFQGFAQEEVDVLIPHARHFHLRQAAEGAMQLPAREGAIDFSRLLVQLREIDYGGYLTLEYQWEEWLDCHRVDCVSETAELRDLLVAAGTGG